MNEYYGELDISYPSVRGQWDLNLVDKWGQLFLRQDNCPRFDSRRYWFS